MEDDPTLTESADQAAEAAEDAWLDALPLEEGDEAPPQEAAAKAVEPEESAPVEDQREPEADEAAPEPETEQSGAAEPEDAEDFEKALTALRFEKTPDSVIESLSRKALIEWGLKVRHRQIARDVELADIAKRRKELERQQATGATEPISAEPTVASDLASLDPVFRELGEEAGGALKAHLERMEQRMTQRTQELQGALQSAQARAAEAEVGALRDRLGERFPGLRDEASFAKVADKMNALAELVQAGKYEAASIETLMLDATRLVGLQEKAPGRARDTETARRIEAAKGDGVPSSESKRTDAGVRGSVRGAVDPNEAALEWLEEHPGDVEGARKAFRSVTT